MEEPIVADSALKHGVAREAILYAFRNPILAYDVDDGFTMLIGPAPNADLIELGGVSGTEELSSCMRCRHDSASSSEE